MNHEEQQRGEIGRERPANETPDGDKPQWDPREQVGDIYSVDVEADGQIRSIDKLPSDDDDDDNVSEPENDDAPRERPSIWIGSWLDYNNGVLYGRWIDAAREDDEVWADVSAMLAGSPTAAQSGEVAEDWGIFDYEGFGPLRVGEQETVGWVSNVARGIAEHGLAFAAYADVMQEEEVLDGFSEAYLGHYDSVESYAEQLVDDLGYDQLLDEAMPEHLRPYVQIDVAGLARDMATGGDVHVLEADGGGVWIFDGR